MPTSFRFIPGKLPYSCIGFTLAAGILVSGCSTSVHSSEGTTTVTETAQSVETPVQTASPGDAATPSADTGIVPGDRVGPVTARTTYEDLVALYGESALEDIDVSMGEGTVVSGTRVNQGDRSFSVVWTDETRMGVESVRDFGPAWQVAPGIGIGTSFSDLQAELGEFKLYGFGWDYGGTLVLDGTPLEPYQGTLVLRVSSDKEPAQVTESYEAVMGEQLFLSGTPALQDLNLSVSEMIVTLL